MQAGKTISSLQTLDGGGVVFGGWAEAEGVSEFCYRSPGDLWGFLIFQARACKTQETL